MDPISIVVGIYYFFGALLAFLAKSVVYTILVMAGIVLVCKTLGCDEWIEDAFQDVIQWFNRRGNPPPDQPSHDQEPGQETAMLPSDNISMSDLGASSNTLISPTTVHGSRARPTAVEHDPLDTDFAEFRRSISPPLSTKIQGRGSEFQQEIPTTSPTASTLSVAASSPAQSL